MRRLLKNTDGGAALEFAILSMVFVGMVVGLFEFGRLFYHQGKLSFAADNASRLVLVTSSSFDDDTATEAQVLTNAKAALSDTAMAEKITVDLDSKEEDGIKYRTMKISYTMHLVIPGFTDGITLSEFRKTPML